GLLGEPVENLRARITGTPNWMEKVRIAFAESTDIGKSKSSQSDSDRTQKLGFLVGIEPLIKLGLDRLGTGISALARKHKYLPYDSSTVGQLMIAGLPQQLVKLMARTMVLELNVARLQGFLAGTTSEERYISFLERLSDPAAMLSILREYPVLARQ